jgi:hypothetical protein
MSWPAICSGEFGWCADAKPVLLYDKHVGQLFSYADPERGWVLLLMLTLMHNVLTPMQSAIVIETHSAHSNGFVQILDQAGLEQAYKLYQTYCGPDQQPIQTPPWLHMDWDPKKVQVLRLSNPTLFPLTLCCSGHGLHLGCSGRHKAHQQGHNSSSHDKAHSSSSSGKAQQQVLALWRESCHLVQSTSAF